MNDNYKEIFFSNSHFFGKHKVLLREVRTRLRQLSRRVIKDGRFDSISSISH